MDGRSEKVKKCIQFNPLDLKEVKEKTLGSECIGGKAKGLIFAKIHLEDKKAQEEILKNVMVPESYFLATDVYQDFLEFNGIDKIIDEEPNNFKLIQQKILEGIFPEYVIKFLEKVVLIMDYPLAIRSSSLLEDSIKYSFAGKYFTTFIPNTGNIDKRLKQITSAIKQIYASTYGKNAVVYREKHNLSNEKMAIIIQQLFGKRRKEGFYPEVAGVGFSQNYRRFTERIRKEDGVVRIVFGLGTRSTGRGYARIFSLTNLSLRPEGNNPWEIAKYSQETFDMLDMDTGELKSYNINDRLDFIPFHRNFGKYASLYSATENMLKDIPPVLTKLNQGEKIVFTFDNFPAFKPRFFRLMEFLFRYLEDLMGIAVDVEWAYEPEDPKFALVQVRPLTSYEEYSKVEIPKDIKKENIILAGDRMLTNGVLKNVRHIVYVDYEEYNKSSDKYEVAREVGRINEKLSKERYILVGPGRWGSSNPNLGVPATYNEISNCGMLVELGIKTKNFMPELSYGTHFFADLDLDGVLYMPVFDSIETNIINFDFFKNAKRQPTENPAIWIMEGLFDAYLDGEKMRGVVVSKE